MNMRNRAWKVICSITFVATVYCLSVPTPASAQTPCAPGGNPNSSNNNGSGSGTPKPCGTPVTQTFGGLTFGVGIGLTENVQAQSRVASASVVNGIVRVTQTNDAIAGIVLESHYFFVPNRKFFTVDPGDWGHGPFVGIVAGSTGTDVITAFAVGWMIGLR
jgi:hypothetical protein